jgi:hypothetical protein
MTARGERSKHGIRSFVVGTGGVALRPLSSPRVANSIVGQAHTHGVLKLSLNGRGYAWDFVPVAGKTWDDSGWAPCR